MRGLALRILRYLPVRLRFGPADHCSSNCSFLAYRFVNEMLVEYGIAKDARSTGYYAGVLEAVLSFANMATMAVGACTRRNGVPHY